MPSWKWSFTEPGASEAVWARAPSWSSKLLGARLAQDHSARAVVCWDLTWRCHTAASCSNRDEMLRDRGRSTWLIRVSGLGGRVGERGCGNCMPWLMPSLDCPWEIDHRNEASGSRLSQVFSDNEARNLNVGYFVCDDGYHEFYPVFNRKPVQLIEQRPCIAPLVVLDMLQLADIGFWCVEQQRVAVI